MRKEWKVQVKGRASNDKGINVDSVARRTFLKSSES